MNSYNLCDESWIPVQYKDGCVKKVGITQVLKEAQEIKDIMPPVFRGEHVDLYEVLIIRLLATIVMSAYYKEGTNYASKRLSYLENIRESGCYTDIVSIYLDKFHDRFDLFSSEHPFLQNIELRDKLVNADKNNLSYLTWNPLAPGGNNSLFGKNRSVDSTQTDPIRQYPICAEEFAYIVMYLAVMGNYPAATVSKESSLGKGTHIYVMIKGENLLETILNNIFPLKQSSRPLEDDEKPDMPVWELHNIHEMDEYPREAILHNRLALAFYPGISVLAETPGEDGYIRCIVRRGKNNDDSNLGLSEEETKLLSESTQDPATIVTWKDQKETNEIKRIPLRFNPESSTATALCIAATKHTENYYACPILDNLVDDGCKKVFLYYRELDGMQVTLLSCGVVDGNNVKTWMQLQDESKHEMAVNYQKVYSNLKNELRQHLKRILPKGETVFLANALRTFSEWTEKDFFGCFTEELAANTGDALENSKGRMCNEVVKIYEKKCTNAVDMITLACGRKAFYMAVAKKTKRRENNADTK